MIQRIQTVFLFLVAVSMVLVLIFPIWQQVNPSQTQMATLTAWNLNTIDVESGDVIESELKIFIAILALVSMALALFSIFQYKNRTRQMFLNMMNSLAMVVNIGIIIWTSHSANELINPQVNGAFVLGFWAIFAGMIMNLLANRFIRKDEMLVRSVDRIR
ncbi:protein of unknown function [Aquiflexum balticum DSM 16537]|uniref:DUF4293 family protein n=1 Tax=Aquiflexum balticum DSM 16537 TaxID=758820 RepID=A0A1W2H3I2_9BACT|nr:DUF4293 domain-containing protein [Aquiflexum balticum]SMD43188.1 protein of unknown function [Aquiflexum balticum DSM 16537]